LQSLNIRSKYKKKKRKKKKKKKNEYIHNNTCTHYVCVFRAAVYHAQKVERPTRDIIADDGDAFPLAGAIYDKSRKPMQDFLGMLDISLFPFVHCFCFGKFCCVLHLMQHYNFFFHS
jgi:hypothetical protein